MTYFGELRANWRFLAAASIGMAFGYDITLYVTNIFTPHLLREFGWSKAQFAIAGVVHILSVIIHPIAGHLTDVFGARRMATLGVISAPLIFVAYSAMAGDFSQYYWITIILIILVGNTTTDMVYCRVIAEQFNRAGGAALAIAGCAPAVVGAAFAPFLSNFIDAHGWRVGYLIVAAFTAVGGFVALLLMLNRRETVGKVNQTPRGHTARDFLTIVRSPTFQIVVAGMILCSLPFFVQVTQLTVILLERGVTSEAAAWMVSLLAVSVVIGRLICGLAIDRFAPPIVAAVALGLPAIGLFILASGVQESVLLAAAVALLGLSMGAKVNVVTYLSMRYFRVQIFSSVVGLIGAAIALSGSAGSLLLGLTLEASGDFTIFLFLGAAATIVGSGVFLLLGRLSLREAAT